MFELRSRLRAKRVDQHRKIDDRALFVLLGVRGQARLVDGVHVVPGRLIRHLIRRADEVPVLASGLHHVGAVS